MEIEMKLKILFRIPFTLYFLAIAEMRDIVNWKRNRYLCLAVKEFLDHEHKTNYYFSEISRHKHIEIK
jgi:hypothetical protein